jgi:nitrogenase subunit NifH
MILKAFKENGKWYAEIWDGSVCLQHSVGPENRVGCAIRNTMNRFELLNGKPTFESLTFNIEDW